MHAPVSSMHNSLFFGDNLTVLREEIPDESVDLIYLDPPFNSNASYNVLFKSPKGQESHAQIEAFEDTWHWGEQAEREFSELLHQSNTDVAEMMEALRRFLGQNDMMAYLTMIATRLLELHRVLKKHGSIYLHCDPTSSHYLKMIMDGVFGKENFRTEISWKRSSAHNDAKQGRKQYGNVRDVIFFYTKEKQYKWNTIYTQYSEHYVKKNYRHIEEASGRRYRLDNLTAAKGGGDTSYEFMGTYPYKGRYWAYSKVNMAKFYKEGRLYFPQSGGTPCYKRYLDEMPGVSLQNDWTDIQPASGQEYLGYPTQKPLALLERIVNASSNPGGVVLDPFCGCGTAVHAAHKLGREWIGIDITHLAISLVEKRLKDAFPEIEFEVHGTPKDLEGASDLAERDKYQFEWWACSLVNAQPYKGKKKGADSGIDGVIFFQDESKGEAKKIIVSVKGGKNVSVAMIRDLAHVVDRENAAIGFFVTLTSPTKPMTKEAATAGFYLCPHNDRQYPKIQILTIEGLLNGHERPEYLDLTSGAETFKKAKKETKRQIQKKLL